MTFRPFLRGGFCLGFWLLSSIVYCAMAVPLSQFLVDPPTPIPPTPYKTIGSVPETLTIFNPADWKATDHRPVIILIHGGAWVAGDDKVFYPHARYFASRGAVAISINYRLVTATGSSLNLAPKGAALS